MLSQQYPFLLSIITFVYGAIFDRNGHIEKNILQMIAKYAVGCLKCNNEIDVCDQTINYKITEINNYIFEHNRDINLIDFDLIRNINDSRLLCLYCVEHKNRQRKDEPCYIYHNYDGNETNKCYGCDKLLCNHCIQFNGFGACMKCGNNVCHNCESQAPLKCRDSVLVLECKSFCCRKCYDENKDECDTLIVECDDESHIF